MKTQKLSAVFYSRGNIEKAYQLKNKFWKSRFELINVNKFSDLVFNYLSHNLNLMVVDLDTISLNDEVLEILFQSQLKSPDNVVFVSSKQIDSSLGSYNNSYLLNYNNFEANFDELMPSIMFNIDKQKLEKFDIVKTKEVLSKYMLYLGFSPKYTGFTYIKHCIEEALKEDGILKSLSKVIYPAVARRNKTTAVNVERNIRNSIGRATKLNDYIKEKLQQNISCKISNREFLGYLLDYVLYECFNEK